MPTTNLPELKDYYSNSVFEWQRIDVGGGSLGIKKIKNFEEIQKMRENENWACWFFFFSNKTRFSIVFKEIWKVF